MNCASVCFTHVDPFEDTESHARIAEGIQERRFTHVDPFEDTERAPQDQQAQQNEQVSPTSIRSRILKGYARRPRSAYAFRFTHVDPFEDTERFASTWWRSAWRRFTHVDPFEDTERRQQPQPQVPQ